MFLIDATADAVRRSPIEVEAFAVRLEAPQQVNVSDVPENHRMRHRRHITLRHTVTGDSVKQRLHVSL